ncbi:Threonine aspartase 1 [Geodia barretti]|uniref:Threonine aspartase 1 n=1 Tax=Geodia barretti TaxID=519541 RepID=A0AA35R0B2_GEOBA|nr:Threonine aspartase 1 [Geodia barretti]
MYLNCACSSGGGEGEWLFRSWPSMQARDRSAPIARAGYHSNSNSSELKAVCRTACKEAMVLLEAGHTSSDAISRAISVLENSPLTNAGRGSNLTLTGTVECDASIMDSGGGFGAVGAASGVPNPISLALRLLQKSSEGCLPLGRVSPIVLVAEGAGAWARQEGLNLCLPDDLITDRARSVYVDHKSRLDEITAHPPVKKRKMPPIHNARIIIGKKTIIIEISLQSVSEAPLDTVGAVCVDKRGGVAGGVSSGGISLKFPGRIGQAAVYGCGCWAERDAGPHSRAVASSTSGTGEYIIKTMLAREAALAAAEGQLHVAMREKFLESRLLTGVEERLAGVIAVSLDHQGGVEFSWGHTTESMCIAYCSSAQTHNESGPTAFISKLEAMDKIGKTVQTAGIALHS